MTKEQRVFAWVMVVACAVSVGALVLDVVLSRKARHNVEPPPSPVKVVRDGWKEAHKAGAPIYRYGEQPADWPSIDPLPALKAYVLTGNGVAFATDDLADVHRWYAELTAPALDLSRFPAVRYLYEVEHVELVERDGRQVLSITIHEARTGCVKPACDPVMELPNYDRRYVVTNPNWSIHIEGGGNA